LNNFILTENQTMKYDQYAKAMSNRFRHIIGTHVRYCERRDTPASFPAKARERLSNDEEMHDNQLTQFGAACNILPSSTPQRLGFHARKSGK